TGRVRNASPPARPATGPRTSSSSRTSWTNCSSACWARPATRSAPGPARTATSWATRLPPPGWPTCWESADWPTFSSSPYYSPLLLGYNRGREVASPPREASRNGEETMTWLDFREPVSAWTHFAWMLLAVPATWQLWRLGRGSPLKRWGGTTFGLTLA